MNEISKANRYRSYFEVAQKITSPEARLAFYEAVDFYTFKGIEPENLPIEADIAFTAIKPNIDADLNRKHAGAPAGNQNAKKQLKNNSKTIKNNSKQLIDLEKTNNEDVDVNEDVEVDGDADTDNACVPAYIPEPNKKINKELAERLHAMIQEHNSTVTKDRRVPISNNVFNFCCKEMRELIPAIRPGSGEAATIINSLENFLKVCRSDTWMRSHTWSTFCKHYTDYTPEFFTLERYLNAEPQIDDATQRPEYKFYMQMRTEARFHVETFEKHIDDWKKAGRPEGEAYYKLQDEWEVA